MSQLKYSIFSKQLEKVEEQKKLKEIEIWNNNKVFLNELSDTLSLCAWTKFKGKSVHGKGSMIRVTSNTNDKMAKRSRELVDVTPLPPKDTWIATPCNFMVPDAKELLSIPYLGDDTDGFIDEWISDHGCPLREDKSNVLIDDNVFVGLVQALIQSQTVLEKTLRNQELLPQLTIFQSIFPHISHRISHNTTVDELQQRYLKLTGNHSECTQNVDGPMTTSLTREQALHSYHQLFCRRCCIYNCQLHSFENINSQRNFPVRVRKGSLLKPFQEPCSDACYMLVGRSSSKEQNNNAEVRAYESAHSTEWTATDQTIFLSLLEVFPGNDCTIAKIMITKSCREVYQYRDDYIKSSDIQPVTMTINKKRKVYKRSAYKVEHNEQPYLPCYHEGPCDRANANCSCIHCEKFCNCSAHCTKRVRICHCKTSCNTDQCFCHYARRECSESCKCEACKNNAIQRRLSKKLEILPSKVHGWGVYIQEVCQKDELINEYRGEIISIKESNRRGIVYDKIGRTYLFTLNDRYVIDANRFGCKIRFANYSKTPNCVARVMMVNGDQRIGIYANGIIQKGEELMFDYRSFDPTA